MDRLVVGMPGLVRLLRHGGRDLVATMASRYWWEFEDPLPLAVAALIDGVDGSFYDVGANTGFYSVLVGRLRPDLTVRAFEPVPRIADHFDENMAVNGLPVVVERVALSDEDGQAELYLPPDDHGLIESSASLDPSFKEKVAATLVVRCERLDAAQARLGDERIGFMKIDVEGAEGRVLAGAVGCLERDRPIAAVELLPRAPFDFLAELMRTHGYALVSMRPGLEVAVETAPRFIEDSWNQLLVPAEELDDVLARLAAAAAVAQVDDEALDLTVRERLLWDQATVERRAGQAELEEMAELLAGSGAEIDLVSRLQVVEAQRDEARKQRDDNDALAREAERRVAELTASTSWRVTSPLRWMSSAVSRRSNR